MGGLPSDPGGKVVRPVVVAKEVSVTGDGGNGVVMKVIMVGGPPF